MACNLGSIISELCFLLSFKLETLLVLISVSYTRVVLAKNLDLDVLFLPWREIFHIGLIFGPREHQQAYLICPRGTMSGSYFSSWYRFVISQQTFGLSWERKVAQNIKSSDESHGNVSIKKLVRNLLSTYDKRQFPLYEKSCLHKK